MNQQSPPAVVTEQTPQTPRQAPASDAGSSKRRVPERRPPTYYDDEIASDLDRESGMV